MAMIYLICRNEEVTSSNSANWQPPMSVMPFCVKLQYDK